MDGRWRDSGCCMLHAGWWIALQGKKSVVQFLVNGRSDLLVDSLSTPCRLLMSNASIISP